MKIGIFGGGFKPFTTGHFAKLAKAIDDNDRVFLFYGLQKPAKIGKRGKPLAQHGLRGIGDTGRKYTAELSRKIFDIYEQAIEREFPNVEVESTIGSSPWTRTFEIIQEFAENPDLYDSVIVYGDINTIRHYLRRKRYFGNLLDTGKLQLGAITPESPNDYLDEDTLLKMAERSEEHHLDALEKYYPGVSRDELARIQQVRGTEVRQLASVDETTEEAKRFLPPFLKDDEKQKIIDLLTGSDSEQPLPENYIRYLIRGMIRG